MSDLISKKALIEAVNIQLQNALDGANITGMTLFKQKAVDCKNFIALIKEMPSIEAVPVVHGRWIIEERAGVDYWCCSECHKIKSEYYAKPKDNFCGNCGADMRKKK